MLIRRAPDAVFSMFRSNMLAAFARWRAETKPTRAEIDAEIAATISAMRQLAEIADRSETVPVQLGPKPDRNEDDY